MNRNRSEPVRIGVVGCGAVTVQAHLPAIAATPGARLGALVDRDREWARQLGRKVGCKRILDDHRQLAGLVDAAIVATPAATHPEIACELLELGLDVLCEKPAATRSVEVRRMFATSERTGGRLLIAQSKRFTPTLECLHRLVDGGVLGRDGHLTASFGGRIADWPARTDFREKPQLSGGGALMDQGVHLIDLAVWLFGAEPLEVRCETAGGRAGAELDAEIRLTFPGGGTAHLAVSHSRALSPAVSYRSPAGWVRTKLVGNQLEFFARGARACRLDGVQQPVLPPAGTIAVFSSQIRHFCDAIRRDEPLLVTAEEAARVLEVIEQCYAATASKEEA